MQNLLSLGLVIALAGTFPSGNKLPDLEAIYPRSILNQGDLGRLEHVFERALKGEPITNWPSGCPNGFQPFRRERLP